MKTAKITNIEKKSKPFITNDGKTLYVFELKLDNGMTRFMIVGKNDSRRR